MSHRTRAMAMAGLVALAITTPLGGRVFRRACAANEVHVAIVVDPGTGAAVSTVCVPATARENAAVLLAARASLLGTPQPRYAPSGLLCGIDGVPSTGCGERQDGHYPYWSYWHGTGGHWTYANSGPATWRVDPGTVEGWRWQPQGSAEPTDPPPRGPVDPTAICVPPPPPTTQPPSTTAPATTGHTPVPATVATALPFGAHAPPTTNTAKVLGTGGSVGASPTTGAHTGGTTDTTKRGHASTTSRRRTRATSSPPSTVALTTGGIAAAEAPTARGSGGLPIGLVVGVLLLVGIGAAGAVAARRRRPAS